MEPIYDIEIENVSKSFDSVIAVDNINLQVTSGSFTTLLGPSGCGKTTLLRTIQGFYLPDNGKIKIAGEDQTFFSPDKRNCGMVFQDYALFPHMTVKENLVYGLKLRKITNEKITQLLEECVDSLGLENLLNRFPHQLSGGQQQRVAVGRAIILKPRVLLMDEPLSNLDAKLRMKVRDELKELQNKLKITTLYVTHDREEALSLSDNVAVMNMGKLEQFDTPLNIYFNPKNTFVADFAGEALYLEGKKDFTGVIISTQFCGTVFRYKVGILSSDVKVWKISQLIEDTKRASIYMSRPEWIHLEETGKKELKEEETCNQFITVEVPISLSGTGIEKGSIVKVTISKTIHL
jgi:ABC-type Fe3+/spermidine/putrescine transport system ATPase subunit